MKDEVYKIGDIVRHTCHPRLEGVVRCVRNSVVRPSDTVVEIRWNNNTRNIVCRDNDSTFRHIIKVGDYVKFRNSNTFKGFVDRLENELAYVREGTSIHPTMCQEKALINLKHQTKQGTPTLPFVRITSGPYKDYHGILKNDIVIGRSDTPHPNAKYEIIGTADYRKKPPLVGDTVWIPSAERIGKAIHRVGGTWSIEYRNGIRGKACEKDLVTVYLYKKEHVKVRNDKSVSAIDISDHLKNHEESIMKVEKPKTALEREACKDAVKECVNEKKEQKKREYKSAMSEFIRLEVEGRKADELREKLDISEDQYKEIFEEK